LHFSLSRLIFTIYPLLIVGTGLWLTVRLKGLQLVRLGTAFRETFGKAFRKREQGKGLTSFQASAAALAGSLGTGNIIGVGIALASGGPGALFWMWISAFLGMAVKYGEILLAVKFRKEEQGGAPSGGPMFYIERAFRSAGPAIFFAGASVAASFGIGNLTQSGAASEAVADAFGVPRAAAGILMAVLVYAVMNGGIARIGRTAEFLVPIMGIAYITGALTAILPRLSELPGIFILIVRDAFSAEAFSGGMAGFLTGKAIRVGVSRGVFTNEAGMGSASIVHGSADAGSPVEEGLWGIVEVFLDTIVMCTLTGAVILLSGVNDANGASLTVNAFETFLGKGAAGFISLSVFCFAFASILSWGGIGEAALRYLSAGRGTLSGYRIIYSVSAAAGAVFPLETVFRLSDLLNFLMAVPNLAAIVLLSNTIIRETQSGLSIFHKKPSK